MYSTRLPDDNASIIIISIASCRQYYATSAISATLIETSLPSKRAVRLRFESNAQSMNPPGPPRFRWRSAYGAKQRQRQRQGRTMLSIQQHRIIFIAIQRALRIRIRAARFAYMYVVVDVHDDDDVVRYSCSCCGVGIFVGFLGADGSVPCVVNTRSSSYREQDRSML